MSAYDLSKLSVMIVDDQMSMRRILRSVLKEWKVREVFEAEDGRSALTGLKSRNIDLMITDYHMEPMDGFELTKRIRAGTEGIDPFMPIIMVTAYTEINNIISAREAGVTEFLAKPFSAKLVYYRIRSVIENPRPFVKTETYNGPDRRRKSVEIAGPERRGVAPSETAPAAKPAEGGAPADAPKTEAAPAKAEVEAAGAKA